ncbi:MAG: beta-ketoacyl-[acyl-carrier-protein] synthase family protein [Gaiellaceae bacterium]
MSAGGELAGRRRVAITGIGLVAPIGIGKEAFWAAAKEGRSGTGRPTRLEHPDTPVKVVGEVKDFVPTDYISKKLMVRTDRNTQFSFAACFEAVEDAGIDPAEEQKDRVGIVLSSNYGGLSYFLENLERLHQKGPSFVSAYMATAWLPSAPVGQLSIHYGTTGYSKTVINDAAGGADAIGAGYRAIGRGDADVVIAGGFEVPLVDPAIVGLATFDDFCKDAPEPEKAFRPFDVDRRGIVIAEGGGIVILEELERAQARRAKAYAEITGYAQTSDAAQLQQVAPDGVQYARAMRLALEQGGLGPDDVGYVNADGRATAEGDRAEARALQLLLGDRVRSVPVSAPKSMTGNSLAGAGPIDVAFASLALRHGLLPPTINLDRQDPECDLRLVANQPEEATVDVVLVCARGTTGVNSALSLKRLD